MLSLNLPNVKHVYMYPKSISMNWGEKKLRKIAQEEMGIDPNSGAVFLFFNKQQDQMKIFFLDATGSQEFLKILPKGAFLLPAATVDEPYIKISRKKLKSLFKIQEEKRLITHYAMTDINSLILKDTKGMPKAARKLRDFLCDIVYAATANKDAQFLSPIRCQQTTCIGTLHVKRFTDPQKLILWRCSDCEDGGGLSRWEHTDLNLKGWQVKKPSEEDPELEITVSSKEWEALRKGIFLNEICMRMVFGAQKTSKGIRISGLASEFEDFLSFVLTTSSHRNESIGRIFDAIHTRASDVLDDYILRFEK